jgi:hypothetical protein
VPTVLKSGSLNLLEPLGPVQALNGIALDVYLATLSIDQVMWLEWDDTKKNELERCVRLRRCPNLWYYADIRLESLTGTTEYVNELAHFLKPDRTGDLQKSGQILYCFFFHSRTVQLGFIEVSYLPIDDAQGNCFKKNIKIYIKTAPTCFGANTIIRERII